jgi:superfamily II DNA or RNA helicase
LTHDEHSEYARLSEQIRKLYAHRSDSEDESRIQRLLEKRRLVLEAAEEKLDSLRSSLVQIGPRNIKHTLIYCTDKNPEQLKDVNALLHELDIKFHQVTDEESSNPKLLSRVIAEFRRGNLQVLTAKRILDEGFNMPEISTAFILASTTVERQWTQRRGRVLRMCDSIGKEFANIHDFMALPPVDVTGDPDAKNIVEAEMVRVKEFARLALDRSARGGANEQLDRLTSEYIIWTESK